MKTNFLKPFIEKLKFFAQPEEKIEKRKEKKNQGEREREAERDITSKDPGEKFIRILGE